MPLQGDFVTNSRYVSRKGTPLRKAPNNDMKPNKTIILHAL